MNWYGLPVLCRILFISAGLLFALYLAFRAFRSSEKPGISTPNVNKPILYCEQMTIEEYEKVGREYTKEQVKRLKSSPEFKKHVERKKLARCKSAEIETIKIR